MQILQRTFFCAQILFSDGEDDLKFRARNTPLLVIHRTHNEEKQSRDSMCRYQFLGGFPTANLTSNPQKKASHRKFNLKNCAIKGYTPQHIVAHFFKK